MPEIFNEKSTSFVLRQSPIYDFRWHTSQRLSTFANSKHLQFDIRSLDPDKFSYPYHFHRNSEEVFVILSGQVTLRIPDEFKLLSEGDIVFFEMGPSGAHQLYNHSEYACRYLDIRTNVGLDVCEYPDSEKINIIPYQEIFEVTNKVDYYKNEDKVREKWPIGIIRKPAE